MNEREMPEIFGGGLWADQTIVHPLGLTVLAVCLLSLTVLPRRYMFFPLLFLAVAIPSVQRVAVLSLDFTFLRILILMTLLVAVARGHVRDMRWMPLDTVIVAWALWSIVGGGLQAGNLGAVVTRTGAAIDALGAFLVGRIYIRSIVDIRTLCIGVAILAVPTACMFLLEQSTGRNLFSIFGGVPPETIVRQGKLRCQGPFSHPILAGAFWATIVPLFLAFWRGRDRRRWTVLLGAGCATFIVFATASSTPVLTLAAGLAGIMAFSLHRHLALLMWLGIGVLSILHILMEQPIWHLISRVDLAGGSTGWHRYNLINQFILRVDEWWMIGTSYTGHWGWGLQDLTNQYVLEGVRGGMLRLLLFALFLYMLFSQIAQRLRHSNSRYEKQVFWGCWVFLFAHAAGFISVSYFGQMTSLFFLLAGGIACASMPAWAPRPLKRPTSIPVTPPRSGAAGGN
ncbi:hypothetical protein [Biformimicrobium ophioploci]|uniref:O-antigen ligase domain-containing protein n=1 Tax=Biformimicrobium ophioploci TaxID=3036711 RepID=A0ABQ6M079_9GAMM|nr:hypothetical protein [Microbulbifer sp. NKW57]GMG87748.1 hypothetical protein MNKW57_20690 [Microbulbifer sp. NKW57]